MLTSIGLEVHHIRPLREAWEHRLDIENCLTLCQACHELAERGEIEAALLLAWAGEDARALLARLGTL